MLYVGAGITLFFVLLAILAPVISPYAFDQYKSGDKRFPQLAAPSSEHLMGTTVQSTDVLSRVIWGAQTELKVVAISLIFALTIGVPLGLLSGYFGGKLDRGLVLVMDALYAFPYLLLAIVIAFLLSNSFGKGILTAAIAISAAYVPLYFRVVRNQVIALREESYVEAARALGAKPFTIIRKYVFYNVVQNVPPIATLNAADAILVLTALGFLGYGIQPTDAAEWGYDISRAVSDTASGIWWTGLFPGLAIVLLVTGLTLVGEGLNETMNPVLRKRRVREGHVRGGAGAADRRGGRGLVSDAPVLSVHDLRVHYGTPRGTGPRRRSRLVRHRRGGGARARRRVGVRQVDARPRHPRPASGRGVLQGEVLYGGRNLVGLPAKELSRLRGPDLGLIFQEPMTRLNPLLRIEDHFKETLEQHEPQLSDAEVRARSLETLGKMGIPPTRFRQYPHEFSGGMRQRIMIALALVLRPKLLVADEPTTSLDVIVEAQILAHPRRPEAQLRDRAAADHAQPRDHRRGLRPGRGHVRRQDRRGGRRARRLRRAGAPVHARAAPVDDLAGDDRAALDPRGAAEPDRPAARLPLPPSLPRRDARLRLRSCRRAATRRRPPRASAGCTARRRRYRRGETEPLEREEIAVADEA